VNGIGPEECRVRRGRLSQACEAIGRDPATLGFSLMNFTLVGLDRADLERRAERLMERQGRTGDVAGYLASLGSQRIAGTVDEVVDRLGAYAEAGVQRVMLQHLQHDDLEAVALIGSQLIPAVADL
jgi:alkanesulfonate monooxygenase